MRVGLQKLNRTSWLAIALALISLQTAIRIECLNYAAGGYLPRRPESNGIMPKWRGHVCTTPEQWLARFGPRDEKGQPVDRPLTVEETGRMHAGIERAKRLNRLRDVVGSWGVVQHLIVPLMMMLAVANILRGDPDSIVTRSSPADRKLAGVLIGVGCVLAILMFYRRYWLSLGW